MTISYPPIQKLNFYSYPFGPQTTLNFVELNLPNAVVGIHFSRGRAILSLVTYSTIFVLCSILGWPQPQMTGFLKFPGKRSTTETCGSNLEQAGNGLVVLVYFRRSMVGHLICFIL